MNKNGFTLVEILVSVSIVILISSLGLAAYTQFSQRQILDQAVSTIVSDMRLAQSMALQQEKPSTCANFQGYAFVIESSGGIYRIDSLCTEPTEYKSVSLNGVTFSGLTRINFRILGRQPVFTGGQTLTVTSSVGNKIITVGNSGDITSN